MTDTFAVIWSEHATTWTEELASPLLGAVVMAALIARVVFRRERRLDERDMNEGDE